MSAAHPVRHVSLHFYVVFVLVAVVPSLWSNLCLCLWVCVCSLGGAIDGKARSLEAGGDRNTELSCCQGPACWPPLPCSAAPITLRLIATTTTTYSRTTGPKTLAVRKTPPSPPPPPPPQVEWFCFPQGLFLRSAAAQPAPHVSSFVRFTSGVRSYGLCLTFFREVDLLEGKGAGEGGEATLLVDAAGSEGGRPAGL